MAKSTAGSKVIFFLLVILIIAVVVVVIKYSNFNDFVTPNSTQPIPNETPIVTPNSSWENITNQSMNISVDPVITLDMEFLDVGQGDSIIIQYANTTALIDCGDGSQGDKVRRYLGEIGADDVDYLFITHPDYDHIGGCADIVKGMDVKQVIMNGQDGDTKTYKDFVALIDKERLKIGQAGNEWFVGPAKILIIQGYRNEPDTNQNSLVMRVDYYNFSALLTGDCDRDCELNLLLKNIQAKVLKVAHHGSDYGTTKDFIFAVKPELAIISVGPNDYGHPSDVVIGRLEHAKATVLRTDIDGTISLIIDQQTYIYKTHPKPQTN